MPVSFQAVGDVRATVPVVFGFSSPTGGGKTYSALKMASGMAKPNEIFMIDTEAGRALAYKDEFNFQYAALNAPFSVDAYKEAHLAAVKAGAKVIIIDSASHEHEGEGGMLSQAEEILERMAGNDWAKRERCTMIAWAKVKPPRNRFISYLMHSSVVTILCFQARTKTKPVKDENGKTQIVNMGFQPICGIEYTFALTAFATFDPSNPGVPIFNEDSKPLMHQLDHVFPKGKPITAETGKMLYEWCTGEKMLSKPKSESAARIPDKVTDKAIENGAEAAGKGVAAYTEWLGKLSQTTKDSIKHMHKTWSDIAKNADKPKEEEIPL